MDLDLSDFDSFSVTSSSEDLDDIEFLYGGQACNILSSLEETIGKIDDFLLFEKEFIHGDIVCSKTDPSGQMGRVVNIDMFVDLENVHGKMIKDVDSKNLQKLRSISVGDYVVYGPWLGKVDKIVDCVTILFDDGSKCDFTTMGPEKLLPISPNLLEDSRYPYYPGQRVLVELSSVSKSARWLCGTWKAKRDEGTVCAVEAGLVYVDWLGCALVSCERVLAPPCLQDSKKLTLLSCFSHANWQLGDWCILPFADCKGGIEHIFLYTSSCEPIKGHKQSDKEFHRRNFTSNFQDLFVIVKTKTKVDVQWQDGSHSLGLDSQSLFPINIVDAHDFWPGQYVIEKNTCDDPHVPSSRRWGIVRSLDPKEKTVKVKWQTSEVNRASDLLGEQIEETVSAYELTEHPEYSYCLGDVVFSLGKSQPVDHVHGKIYKNPDSLKMEMGEEADLKGMYCGGDQNEFPNNSYLSCIGIVMSFKDGTVEVKWATGLITTVAPCEIIQMDKFEGSSAFPVINEENNEQLNQEITEHDKPSLHWKGKELLDSSFYSLPQAAVGFFTSIVANLFGPLGSTSLPGISEHVLEAAPDGTNEEELEFRNLCTEGSPVIVGDLQTPDKTNLELQIKDIGENEALQFSLDTKSPENFGQFDMVNGCFDHHFADGSGKGLTLSQVKKSWLKKVQQEWIILEKDLPETISVRVYEDRMDLLRAAIVGAPGTPYHDGIFFFDIFLPPEYPHEPPLVHYNSGGLRVNPNLYESGKVCLSLLNTWTGKGTEVWSPESSTILQVLLSLQALVLNEKPYFNEAGYDKQMGRAEGEKNSVSYNENAFLVSCKSMLYLLRKPPKHFEALVEEHFSRRSKYILLACKAYMEGAPVGYAFGCEKSGEENQQGSSTGFKIMLAKLIPRLVEAFSDKGIDCGQIC
ncbi:probable ubiquitin-conjugating enzyme E2 24 [Cornus florida]|uniref:probable ubiquitin-conjugating enzyme E2 24 n=1 Tax=Cornus florida TaxID=4283 RepID=UPI002896C58D|nr:probable ubiquitin-conjugating enzyme E2 24 [Cornus florida]XP_059670878.1 probable ubiquitin-conjugating enzyme E2 24 [Cornus florida]XP_059670882.1 probable ubiquitin-conjugating enzyme E2 24 [Cornus florida]